MALSEPHATQGGSGRGHSPAGEPSVSSSLEHLVAGSQGVITKRIDLALLDGKELLSHSLQGAAFVAFAMVLAAGAWFALAGCLVLAVIPNAKLVIHLAAFGLLNLGAALGLVALAMRRRPQLAARATNNGSSATGTA